MLQCMDLLMLSYACIGPQETCWHRSGLRGAVGLALSLFVFLDDSIADRRFRVLTFFYMGAMAFLTLIIQGTTTPFLLRVRAWAGHAHTAPHPRSNRLPSRWCLRARHCSRWAWHRTPACA